MTGEEYREAAKKTANENASEWLCKQVNSFSTYPEKGGEPGCDVGLLMNGVLGLTGEAGEVSDLEWAIMAILAAVGECKPENISVNRCKYCDIIEAESKTGSVQFVFRQGFRSSLPHHTKTTLAELMKKDTEK